MGWCKGRCNNFERAMRNGCGYANDVVRCRNCEIFFKYEGIYCNCCGTKVRKRSRKSKQVVVKYIQ